MKRTILIILAIVLCVTALSGCRRNNNTNIGQTDDVAGQSIPTDSVEIDSESADVSDNIIIDGTLEENTEEVFEVTDKEEETSKEEITEKTEQTSEKVEDTTEKTEQSTEDENTEQGIPDMQIEDGFSVIDSETISIPVTENKAKVMRNVRVAALRNQKGENALYLDVLSEDNKILSSMTWKGHYQLTLNNEGLLTLMRVHVFPKEQRGTVLYEFYEISDRKISAYDVIELDSPQINHVVGEGEILSATLQNAAAIAMYSLRFNNWAKGYEYALQEQIDGGKEPCLIAECYLDAASPEVYSNSEKVAMPDFENKEISDKYTLGYAISLYGELGDILK